MGADVFEIFELFITVFFALFCLESIKKHPHKWVLMFCKFQKFLEDYFTIQGISYISLEFA